MQTTSQKKEMVIVTVIGGEGLPEKTTGRKMAFSTGVKTGSLSLPWLEEKAAELAGRALTD